MKYLFNQTLNLGFEAPSIDEVKVNKVMSQLRTNLLESTTPSWPY